MASTILSDNGVSSGSAGLKTTADSTGVLALQTSTSGGTATTALTIDTSQNVGIGTTSPASRLDINSSVNSGQVATFRSTATNGGYVFFQGSGSTPTATGYVGAASKLNTGGSVTDFGMTATTNLVFGTNDGTERMRITSAGLVGIGTSSPNLMLTVSGQTISGATGGNGYVLNASGPNYGFISNPSAGVWSLGYGTTPATLGTTVLNWSSSGYVTTPSQPAFRAYLSSGYTCTTGYQTMPFDSTSLNTSSSFSTGTYTFTAPVAGTYFFTAMAYWTSSGSGAAYAGCTIWSNGSQKATGYIYKNTTGSDQCAWSSLIISMSAGDTAYVRTDMSAGLVLAAGNGGGSWFCGYLLG
jgi:hypothetical protein